jgi:hypothetical protein
MNLTYPRSLGVCFTDIESLSNITEFLKSELTNIIELAEYKRYLMIITNNCNRRIDDLIKIKDKDLQYAIKKTYYKLNIKSFDGEYTYESFFNEKLLLDKKYIGITFRLYYKVENYSDKYIDVHLLNDVNNNNNIKICYINDNDDTRLNKQNFIATYKTNNYESQYDTKPLEDSPPKTEKYIRIEINNKQLADKYNKQLADEYNTQNGGILRKNKGKKGVYKSTKQKVSVIIDNKHYNKTVYKNSKGISYIRRNNEYKLLKKYKLSKL